MISVVLQPGRERSVLQHHPWIFSRAIRQINGLPEVGETVEVFSSLGEFLARGAFSPNSQIRIRIWSWDQDEVINVGFFHSRLLQAISLREALIDRERINAYRLVYAESDGIPGLVVDRYANTLVIQSMSCGIDLWRDAIVDLLISLTGVNVVYERSDLDVRELEGLPLRSGVLYGEQPPDLISIQENGLHFNVDVRTGHKTGFYLDQRNNRKYIRRYAAGCEVLDCFAYTGGFTVAALAGGARSVLAIDSLSEALRLAKINLTLNGLLVDSVDFINGDVFQVLRELRDRGRTFSMVVLDPPKFAPTNLHVDRASRAYKDINLLGLKLLRPGGYLVTFSCSGGVSLELFEKIVASAALDARVDAQILERLSQGEDHPVALNYPQGRYLKGLILRRQ